MNLFKKTTEIDINSNTYVITDNIIAEGSFGYIKFGKKKGIRPIILHSNFLSRIIKLRMSINLILRMKLFFLTNLLKK